MGPPRMSERRVQAGALHPLPLVSGCKRVQKKPFLTQAKKEEEERRKKERREKEKKGET